MSARALLFGLSDDVQRRIVAQLYCRFRSNASVTREACEDAFGTAVIKAQDLNPCVESLEGWLVTVAANALRDYLKSPHVHPRRVVHGDALTAAQLDALITPVTDDPLSRLERAGMAAALRDGLRSLTDRQRTVFVQHYLHGLPYAEIAAQLGRSPGAVKQSAHDARLNLRRFLRDDPRILSFSNRSAA